MNKKILFGCFSVPGFGGASTAGYALFKMMQDDGLDVHYVNIIGEEDADYFRYIFGEDFGNPSGLPNVRNCILDRPLFCPDPRHSQLTDVINHVAPDLLVGADHIAALLLKSSAIDKDLIFLTSGCSQVKHLIDSKKTKDAIALTEPIRKAKRNPEVLYLPEAEAVQNADLILTHSLLNQTFYQYFFASLNGKIYPEVIWFAEWIHGDALEYRALSKPFSDRDIDVLFVASMWYRPEKNYEFVKKISARLQDSNIHIVGEVEREISGANHHGLLTDRQDLFSLLGRAKSMVSTSWYDAAPGVLYEASAMGCNIVASKNCGNWRICNEELLVDPFKLENFLKKISLALTKKFDDNICCFLQENSYNTLVSIIAAM